MFDSRDTEHITAWEKAALALAVLAVDPVGVGGLLAYTASGPVRDTLVTGIHRLPLPFRTLDAEAPDYRLLGGFDMSPALSGARPVSTEGILEDPSAVILSRAERCAPRLATQLARAVDRCTHAVIALDEGAGGAVPSKLTERLGLGVRLDHLPEAGARRWARPTAEILRARELVGFVTLRDTAILELVEGAKALGIESLRPPFQAMAVVKALAAMSGRRSVGETDLTLAADLVFSHRTALRVVGAEQPAHEG